MFYTPTIEHTSREVLTLVVDVVEASSITWVGERDSRVAQADPRL